MPSARRFVRYKNWRLYWVQRDGVCFTCPRSGPPRGLNCNRFSVPTTSSAVHELLIRQEKMHPLNTVATLTNKYAPFAFSFYFITDSQHLETCAGRKSLFHAARRPLPRQRQLKRLGEHRGRTVLSWTLLLWMRCNGGAPGARADGKRMVGGEAEVKHAAAGGEAAAMERMTWSVDGIPRFWTGVQGRQMLCLTSCWCPRPEYGPSRYRPSR